MSLQKIRDMLEARLQALLPQLPTEWDNARLDPAPGPDQPLQRVTLMPADPDTFTVDQRTSDERGIFQVLVSYPRNAGSVAATARAERIQAQFPAGLEMVDGPLRLRISRKPAISADIGRADRYTLPVSIPYRIFVKG